MSPPVWAMGDIEALVQYVHIGVARALLPDVLATRLPGPGTGSRLDRARTLFEVLAARGIRYVHEPATSTAAGQEIRPPDQVLARPKEGTCVDLAITYAGMCLDSGLHPMIALLSPTRRGGAGHALVIVWLGGDWKAPDYPVDDDVADDLRHSENEPGAYLAVDVTRCTDGGGWVDAVGGGAEMITGADPRWRWTGTADVGLRYGAVEPHALEAWPTQDVLIPPYLDRDPTAGPLTSIQARRGVVPFLDRDELDVLLDWGETAGQTKISIVHGVGGSGKTHLAAEAAARFAAKGWYTGFLRRDPDITDLRWLAGVVAPLLVVVDYAETAKRDDVRDLMAELRHRPGPVRVLLTARAVSEWWTDDITPYLHREGIRFALEDLELPPSHQRPAAVFRQALRAFTGDRDPHGDPPRGRWTTLDLVMHAWLLAYGVEDLPSNQETLYREVLDHEFRYWRDSAASLGMSTLPSRRVLRAAAASVSLLAPTTAGLRSVLTAVDTLDDDRAFCDTVVDLIGRLLPADPGDGTIAVRPDPVADHLLLAELSAPQAPRHGDEAPLLRRALDRATTAGRVNAVVALTRAGAVDPVRTAALAAKALRHVPDLWEPALEIAAAVGGPFAAALTDLAESDEHSLPWERVDRRIPRGHTTLRALALIAARRSIPTTPPEDDAERSRWASSLNDLATRQADAGQLREALATVTESVRHHRALVVVDRDAHLAGLASALNNLAVRQQENGDLTGSHSTISEAVSAFRVLAAADPAAYLVNLAGALNNLAGHQADTGSPGAALTTIAEAVEHSRALLERDETEYLPHFATMLVTLSGTQRKVGDHDSAITSITEAVRHFRALVEVDPSVHLPLLCLALNGMAAALSQAGERKRALAAAVEAVAIWRGLVQAHRAAFLPDLAASLSNLAVHQSAVGDHDSAMATIIEAVEDYRTLVLVDPDAYLPRLAEALSNATQRYAEVGDHSQAQSAISESITIRRRLAQANPAAFLPELVVSLNNLSALRGSTGDDRGALDAISETVEHCRVLVVAEPVVHSSLLAAALHNLSAQLTATGQRDAALAAITEALAIRRTSATRPSVANMLELAEALLQHARCLIDSGDPRGALASATEAVGHHRRLVETNSGATNPELADALYESAIYRAAVGDRRGALADATETAEIRRDLAGTDANVLPAYAAALHQLAVRREYVGDDVGALEAVTSSVCYLRALADAKPHAHRHDLAAALNTYALVRSARGDRREALAAITDSVAIYRVLSEANPREHLSDLAAALDTRAAQLGALDLPQDALAAIAESVEIRRGLVKSSGAEHLPALATVLNNQAIWLGLAGERGPATAAFDEVVSIRRMLADALPAVHLPDLATSLNNLALHQTDDVAKALTAVREAIAIRHDLAKSEPEAFLADLVASLTTLAGLTPPDRWNEVAGTYEDNLEGHGHGQAAELLLDRATWHLAHERRAHAQEDLSRAAALAAEETDVKWADRSRTKARLVAADGRLDGPEWVVRPLPDDVVALLDEWLAATTWPQADAALREYHAAHIATIAHLDLAMFLRPGAFDALSQLRDLLNEVVDGGIGVLDEHYADYTTMVLIGQWVAAPSARESLAFARSHRESLGEPRALRLLRANAERHAGIVIASGSLSLGQVYDAIDDPVTAAELAITLLETGGLDALAGLSLAVPELEEVPFTGRFIGAVWTVLTGGTHADAVAILDVARGEGTTLQVRSGAVRLRQLGEAHPEHGDSLRELAARLGG